MHTPLLTALSRLATPGYVSPDLSPEDVGRLSARQCAWLRRELLAAGERPQARTIAGETWRLVLEDGEEIAHLTLTLGQLSGQVEVRRSARFIDYSYSQDTEEFQPAPTPTQRRSNGGREVARELLTR